MGCSTNSNRRVNKCISAWDFPVLDARWLHDKKSFYEYIVGIVRRLNPEMKNLYCEQPRVTQKWKDARVSWSAYPTECKNEG